MSEYVIGRISEISFSRDCRRAQIIVPVNGKLGTYHVKVDGEGNLTGIIENDRIDFGTVLVPRPTPPKVRKHKIRRRPLAVD